MENKKEKKEQKPFFNPYPIIIPAKSKLIMNPEDLADQMTQTRDLKFIRGHFLDLIIDVELITDILIENAMLHKKSKLRKVFRNNILNNRNVTFKPKIELLCAIIREKKELNETELKLLNKHLDTLREERNRWAHGSIRFRQEKRDKKLKLQSYLFYINSKGEEKEITLTGSYFDDLTHKLQTIQGLLNKVLIKRGLLPKDYIKKKNPDT